MISVIIDTYNQERFICAALESVLAQSWFAAHPGEYEILVVDDGSTDSAPAIIDEFKDFVRYLRKPNGGQASAFNHGLEHATGEIVMFLDGDDWWHPEKVAKVMAEFEANPHIVAVGHGIVVADDMSGDREEQHPASTTVINLASDAAVQRFHSHMAFMGTSRLAARRDALDRIGRPPEALTYEADEYFFTLLPAIGDVHVLPECLTYYRLHGANLYQESAALKGTALGNEKLVKRAKVFRCLADTMPGKLIEHGIPADRAAAIVEPREISATRLELQTMGGSRSRTFAVERRNQRYLAGRGQGSSMAKRLQVLAASLLMSPPSFYAMRTRYAGSLAQRAHAAPEPAQKGNA